MIKSNERIRFRCSFYVKNKKTGIIQLIIINGALGRNRIHNPLVRSQVLYPVELLALMEVPVGFEPTVIELQSIALPTWLRNHHKHCNYTLLLGIFQVF